MSEVFNASECECDCTGEHGRVKSNNTILRARDKVQNLEMRSESQQGSER
jgi:hypothetical protein